MLDWYKERNEEVRIAFDELCPGNAQMISPTIQKELAKYCAEVVSKAITLEMGNGLFSVLIDESRDISIKEQMAVVVRYVIPHMVICFIFWLRITIILFDGLCYFIYFLQICKQGRSH
jgi:hypothetical protein